MECFAGPDANKKVAVVSLRVCDGEGARAGRCVSAAGELSGTWHVWRVNGLDSAVEQRLARGPRRCGVTRPHWWGANKRRDKVGAPGLGGGPAYQVVPRWISRFQKQRDAGTARSACPGCLQYLKGLRNPKVRSLKRRVSRCKMNRGVTADSACLGRPNPRPLGGRGVQALL